MNPKVFHAFFPEYPKSLKELLCRETILGIARIIHNVRCNLEQSARIITAGKRLRQFTNCLFQKLYVRDII